MSTTIGRPLKPSEVGEFKARAIPDFVFDAFNALIAIDYDSGVATVKTKKVVAEIISRSPGGLLTWEEIRNSGWLNVEEAYRAAGWKVTYDKPMGDETYDAYFTFSARGDR